MNEKLTVAIKLYEESLAQNNKPKLIQSVDIFKELAEDNNAEAQFVLGCFYYKGEGVSQDKARAIAYFTKAANQDHAKSQFNLAQCYNNGDGIAKDEEKANIWYKKAIESGYVLPKSILEKLDLSKPSPKETIAPSTKPAEDAKEIIENELEKANEYKESKDIKAKDIQDNNVEIKEVEAKDSKISENISDAQPETKIIEPIEIIEESSLLDTLTDDTTLEDFDASEIGKASVSARISVELAARKNSLVESAEAIEALENDKANNEEINTKVYNLDQDNEPIEIIDEVVDDIAINPELIKIADSNEISQLDETLSEKSNEDDSNALETPENADESAVEAKSSEESSKEIISKNEDSKEKQTKEELSNETKPEEPVNETAKDEENIAATSISNDAPAKKKSKGKFTFMAILAAFVLVGGIFGANYYQNNFQSNQQAQLQAQQQAKLQAEKTAKENAKIAEAKKYYDEAYTYFYGTDINNPAEKDGKTAPNKTVKIDYQKAVELYKKSAELGNSNAQNNLGYCYFTGHGVDRDYKEAINWYEKAAKNNHRDALNSLGRCYEAGLGVDADAKKAFSYYEKAANEDYALGEYNLGRCYEDGIGVEKDLNKAMELYKKSAKEGYEKSKVKLEKLAYAI